MVVYFHGFANVNGRSAAINSHDFNPRGPR